MIASVRGRFAPTPSGFLHLGSALTALLAWLQIRQQDGVFVLRIEDVDIQRQRPIYTQAILDDLYWLGLNWDEGPDVGGPYAPYQQKDRITLYQTAFAQLQAQGLVYPCFCSRKDLFETARAPHGLPSEGPYPGTCRQLSAAKQALRDKDKTPAWRFMVPAESVSFTDLVAGLQNFPPGIGGDFIIARADGIFSYQFTVVVDDAAMGITRVLRGNDLLDSTPRQLYLYHSLGLSLPIFAHVPLLFSPDGTRLAKRDHALSLRYLRTQGVQPERLIGYLAWLAGLLTHPEPVKAKELIPGFALDRVVRHPVHLSAKWWQKIIP